MMKIQVLATLCLILFFSCKADKGPQAPTPRPIEKPVPLELGYSVGITSITDAKMKKAKQAQIKFVEAAGMNLFFDDNRYFTKSHEEATKIMQQAKEAAAANGIQIWSVHMPYSAHMDLSLIDEDQRKEVVAAHKKLLEYLRILQPSVILFHPSYYLNPPNQRDRRKSQMIKSAIELNDAVKEIGAIMVLENMLGPELMAGNRERPLMRTVEETVEIFDRLPADIYSAIDMNHIKNPEKLVLAIGKRLKTVHIADGTGRAENHFFPCSGEGENNWNDILIALHRVGYEGPFLFESAYNDEQSLADCYKKLYDNFIKKLNQP